MMRRRQVASSPQGPQTITADGARAPTLDEERKQSPSQGIAFQTTELANPADDVTPGGPTSSVHAEIELPANSRSSLAQRTLPIELQSRFQNATVLGAGGMGTVFRAHDKILGRDVALKLLHQGNRQIDETLFREARSQAKIVHENVCKIYEVGTEGESRYLVMQLIQGTPLDEMKGTMTLDQKVRVIRMIAAALHEMHRHGFVHRDVKPSNIMVELVEDGSYKPYLMDFGLAREIGSQGQTVTGFIAGTPLFMAPEQARGEIRKLDRRTDVYSLGATLYDLLCGKPPFEDADLYSLLYKINVKEPPAPRTIDKTIPADVETIVMKCLEKEPQHRYDSAKALGDDLQRYLDGELVRRASIFFLAYKKAKRNKVAVLVTMACSFTVLAFVGTWIGAQRAAERQAIFSRELGEDIKEMELFLRTAHERPTHDIEEDRSLIRTRLEKIQSRMAALGDLGTGPGHYAIGRGHLALQDYENARRHFEKAVAAQFASPQLDYALGMTLGELYRKGLEEIKKIENPEKKKARLEQVNTEFKEPALRRLGAALEGDLSSPEYVKGLIALYAENYEEAKKHAKAAYSREPWLYEAKLLEAEAYFAEGSKYRHDGAFDYDKMMGLFRPAMERYAEAVEIGRSDPKVFLSACEFWRQMLASAPHVYDAASPIFARGSAVCQQGIRSLPRAVEPRIATALLYQVWAHKLIFSTGAPAKDAERFMKEGVAIAKEAAELGDKDAMAQYVYGTALLNEVYYENDRGLDTLPAAKAAVDGLMKAAQLDGTFLWAHNELCKAQGEKLRLLSTRGQDIKEAFTGALEACDRASALEPTWAFPHVGEAQVHLYNVLDKLQYGATDESSFAPIFFHLEQAKKLSPKQTGIRGVLAKGHYYKAVWKAQKGQDPEPSLRQVEAAIEDLRSIYPGAESILANTGLVATLRARQALLAGRDPSAEVEKARDFFTRVSKEAPWDIDYRVYRARVEVVALAWALKEEKATAELFDNALAPLVALLEEERHHAEFYQKIAEIHSLRAQWLLTEKKNPDAALEEGFEMVNRALKIHPRMALAFVTKGELLAIKARSSTDEAERKKTEEQSKAAFALAIKENALLTTSVGASSAPN